MEAGQRGELLAVRAVAGEHAGVPALAPRGDRAALHVEQPDGRARGVDVDAAAGEVERLAADDRVGDLAAVLDVVDGRGGAASDLAAVAPGGAPALRRPVRERDPVLLDPEVVARRRGRGGRGRAGGERGRVLDGRPAGRDQHGREHGDRGAGDREGEPAAAAPVQAARVALPLALERLAQAERRADLVGGAVDERAGAALAVQRVGDRRVVRRERLELAHARGLQRAVGGSRDLRHQAVVEGFRRRHREAVRQQGDARTRPPIPDAQHRIGS